MVNSENILIPFYQGTAGDHQGRTLDEILRWPDELLEDCHDYIQTLFPLPEASRFSSKATLIDRHVFETFRATPELRVGLRRSFDRMLSFYGLEIEYHPENGEAQRIQIRRANNFPNRSQNWVVRVDHNHLRITRIIRSLRILGLEKEAEAFFEILNDIYSHANDLRRPSKESMKYWSRAALRPLNIAPDANDNSDPHAGQEFLWRHESEGRVRETLYGRAPTPTEAMEADDQSTTDDSDGGVMLPKDLDEEEDGKEPAQDSPGPEFDEDFIPGPVTRVTIVSDRPDWPSTSDTPRTSKRKADLLAKNKEMEKKAKQADSDDDDW